MDERTHTSLCAHLRFVQYFYKLLTLALKAPMTVNATSERIPTHPGIDQLANLYSVIVSSIYFRQDVRKIDFFPISSHKTSYTFQLLLISNAMRPEDDSCTDKVKGMYPRSKF